jgi:hypothetical protein
VVPYHTIAFSQQKLRAALRRAAGQDPAFTWLRGIPGGTAISPLWV